MSCEVDTEPELPGDDPRGDIDAPRGLRNCIDGGIGPSLGGVCRSGAGRKIMNEPQLILKVCTPVEQQNFLLLALFKLDEIEISIGRTAGWFLRKGVLLEPADRP